MEFTGPRMPLYVWGALFVFSLGIITIYPDYIAPLMDKYIELPESPLREAIVSLCDRVHFPLTKLYMVAGSVRSAHSNAYFYGFFNNKRIVIFDTLIGKEAATGIEKAMIDAARDAGAKGNRVGASPGAGCSVPQVVAIVAHELGHWAHNHVLQLFSLQQALTLGQFVLFAKLLDYGPMYTEFGFGDARPPFIGFLLAFTFVFAPLNTLVSLGINGLVRKNEYQADAYAARLGLSDALSGALIKLHSDNGSFPVHDWLHSLLHRSHPTLLERLGRLRDKME
jgi:STE24 endopeptidase